MQKNQHGTLVAIVAGLFVLTALGLSGWLLYAHQNHLSVKSYQECINKGYPVLQSNPSVCKASNGQTFTNPNQKVNSSTPTNQAVLSGTVTEGPLSPVCQIPCNGNGAVANHEIQALDTNNNVAASTTTDAQGKYSLNLKPGVYTLILVPKIGFGVIKDNQVNVVSGTNMFNLEADTGIR